MISWTRGWLTEGHVEAQMFRQRFLSSVENARNWDEAHAREAREGPSSRVRMWDWMMSGWTVLIVSLLASPPSLTAADILVFIFFF